MLRRAEATRSTGAARRSVRLAELGVEVLRFVELVFEGDDAAGGVEASALVDQFPDAGGQTQLVAGVTAVAACRALRLDQFRFIEAA